MSIVNGINKITFTETNNLFGHDSKKRQALTNLTGTDSPKEFTIEANYKDSKKLTNFLNSLFNEQKNNTLKELIICGNDENDFEVIFNNETFNRKIEVKNQKDENGKYISNNVKENLLKEIE